MSKFCDNLPIALSDVTKRAATTCPFIPKHTVNDISSLLGEYAGMKPDARQETLNFHTSTYYVTFRFRHVPTRESGRFALTITHLETTLSTKRTGTPNLSLFTLAGQCSPSD